MSKFISYITGASLAMGLVLSGGSAMAHCRSACARPACAASTVLVRTDLRNSFRHRTAAAPIVNVAVVTSGRRATAVRVLVQVNTGRRDRCASRCGDRIGLGIGRFDRLGFGYGYRGYGFRRGW